MRIEIHGLSSIKASEQCRLRAVLFNNSYEPITVSRNAFVGPNVHALAPGGYPNPSSVEATFGGSDEPLTLQPFTFYGRERTFDGLMPGEVEVTAYYRTSDGQEIASASQRLHVEQS